MGDEKFFIKQKEYLDKAISILGSQAALAKALECTKGMISQAYTSKMKLKPGKYLILNKIFPGLRCDEIYDDVWTSRMIDIELEHCKAARKIQKDPLGDVFIKYDNDKPPVKIKNKDYTGEQL